MTDLNDDDRAASPPEGDDGEPILSEGVGGVPDIPESERTTVGDPDDGNDDTHEPR